MRVNIFFKIAVFDTESKYCPVKKLARSISLSFHSNKGINWSFCAERTSHHPQMTSLPLWPRLYRLYLVSVIITGAEREEERNQRRSSNYPSLQMEVCLLLLWSAICLWSDSFTVWVWKQCQHWVINATKCFPNVTRNGAGGKVKNMFSEWKQDGLNLRTKTKVKS